MSVKIWRVEFGYNFSTKDVVAKDVVEAIEKARKLDRPAKAYDWVSKVELLAESDD